MRLFPQFILALCATLLQENDKDIVVGEKEYDEVFKGLT
jgi:hypothetical protein